MDTEYVYFTHIGILQTSSIYNGIPRWTSCQHMPQALVDLGQSSGKGHQASYEYILTLILRWTQGCSLPVIK